MTMSYKLSATLTNGHSADVRALSSPTDDLILSASRDCTAICWQRSSTSSEFLPSRVLRSGTHYINSITYIPPSSGSSKGYVVTGGQDAVINVFSLNHPREDPEFSLVGHTENVCALDATPGGTIISGSWDKTAKVWKSYNLAYDLKGHQQSVLAVLAIDEQQFLTGSADKTIRLWLQHKTINTFHGHRDVVRDVVLMPDIGFASCSNDSEIRVWTVGGDVVYTLSGHTSFVYSLSILPNGDIVSGGEDRTVRVWRDGECYQTIVHPAISVWAVSTMPNGDIVTGCSDAVVRIFSTSKERWLPDADLKAYDEKVAGQALPSQQIGDVKKSDLPGLEVLARPGTKSGEVKMVKSGEIVEAHQWDSASGSWQKIGEVVDAVGQSRKQLYEGKEYDYVFDVDIQDGVPPLKLPYNVTENPYITAQRFLQNNDLPLTYLDEVVRFIEKNTSGVNIGTGGEEYVDPFTGASRYRSSAGSAQSPADNSAYMDPYTGASRYTVTSQPTSTPSSVSYMDPYTGTTRYTMTPSTTSTTTASRILPVSKCTTFKQANVTAMQSKLHQFNDDLRNEISTSSLAMFPEEVTAVDEVFAYLSNALATSPQHPASAVTARHVEAIMQILERWPPSQLFPVIDLSRLLIGLCPDSLSTPGLKDRFCEALFKASEWSASWSPPLSKARETNLLLLFRTLANAFQEGVQLQDEAWVAQIFEALSQAPYGSLTKAQRVALATILFNVSCLALLTPLDRSIRSQHMTLILRIIESETADAEAVYRAAVALGNMIHAAKNHDISFGGAIVGEVKHCLQALPSTFREDRVKIITEEIASLL